MKHRFLLLGAALLMSAGMSAQTFTATRTKAAPPTFSTWAAEDTLYLWNVGAGGFYVNHQNGTNSPYWGTRASINDTIGAKVIFTRTNPSESEAEDFTVDGVLDNTYLLVSYVSKFSAYYCTYASAENPWSNVWTDNNTAAQRYWNVVADGDYIKIEGNSTMNGTNIEGGYVFEGKYMGILDGDADKVVYLYDTESEDAIDPAATFYDQWAAVTPEAYEAYIAEALTLNPIYNAAASLRTAIEKAIAANPGLSLDEQVAVYNNTAATVEELEAAEASISQAIIDYVAGNATVDNPADFTSALTNPDFSTGDATGWNGSPTVDTNYKNAEKYNTTFDVYQSLTGLKKGVYEVGIQAFYRAGDAEADYSTYIADSTQNNNAKLYGASAKYGEVSKAVKRASSERQAEGLFTAASNEWPYDSYVEDGTYIPNSMQGSEQWFNAGYYKNTLFAGVDEEDTLKVGFKKTTTISADWCIFDNFTLYYFGSSLEAYQLWGTNVRESATEYDLSATYHGEQEAAAYNQALSDLENASNIDDIVTAVTSIGDLEDALLASETAYSAYVAKLTEIENWLTTGEEQGMAMDIDEVSRLADYIQMDAGEENDWGFPNGVSNDILNRAEDEYAGKLTTAEITAETAYIDSLYSIGVKAAILPYTDLTSLIKNPGFEIAHGATGDGWLLDTSAGGTSSLTNWHGGNSDNYCAEAYQQYFDVYQIVNGLPQGLYKVSVQAFYRTADNATAYTAYQNDPDKVGDAKVLTYVYFNEFATPVKNVMEIQYDSNLGSNCYQTDAGTYTLNGMTSASTAFSLEDESMNFTQNVYGLVGEDGTMRLGIRRLEGSTSNSSWALWDNFKLTYMGYDVDALTDVIESYITRANALEGETYGDPDKEALNTAIEAAQTAEAGGDGTAMYSALLDLVAAYNQATASIASYAEFTEALGSLLNALEDNSDTASDDAYSNASDLYDNLSELGTEASGSAISAYIDQINAAIAALKIPNNAEEASDDNPVDFTSMIVNPTFDTIGDFTGWSSGFGAGGTTSTNAECYEKNFDVYQDIVGLPLGTYEIRVNGSNRTGSVTVDYTDWTNADDASLTTYLYGVNNPAVNSLSESTDNASTVAIKHLSEGGHTDNDLASTNASGDSNNPWYVANTMAEIDLYFHLTDDDGNPLNTYNVGTFIDVTDDGSGTGTLRIGVYKNDATVVSSSWCIFDDFELIYYGTNSSHAGDHSNAVDIADVPNSAAKTTANAIYSVSGMRLSSLQKGLNIIKMSDGSVKKVFVK